MTLQCVHVYFFSVLVFGILLIGVSFRRYTSMNINGIFVITDFRSNQTSSSHTKVVEQQLLPGDQQVSYPWIGDSTCQHLAVQVSEIIIIITKYIIRISWFLISLRRTKLVRNGRWLLFPGVAWRGHVNSSKVLQGELIIILKMKLNLIKFIFILIHKRIYTGTVYGAGEPPIVSTGSNFISVN